MWRRLGLTGALGLAWTAAPAICGTVLLVHIGTVSDWLLVHPRTGLAAYVIVFVIAAGIGLLPTYAQSVLGGWVFGVWLALPAALIGFTGGAMIGYGIAGRVSQHRIEEMIERHPKARVIRNALIGKGFWRTVGLVSLWRLPINSPFALTNLVMAATGVNFAAFVLGTVIGMIPRTAVAVILAASAAQTGAKDIQEFAGERGLWLLIGGIVAMLAVLLIISAIAKRAIDRMKVGTEKSHGSSK
jgi:uncharacterized membrane protein YdjX (TVP38/TMEM64 family)